MNIVEFLNSKNLTISSAESFTGGGYANHVTNIPGSSACMIGGITSYSNFAKHKLLNVKQETLEKFGAISKETCTEMVQNCREIFNTDIAVAFTGNAGPSASENKEVGLCYIGVCSKDKCVVNELHLQGTREEIKQQAIKLVDELIFILF